MDQNNPFYSYVAKAKQQYPQIDIDCYELEWLGVSLEMADVDEHDQPIQVNCKLPTGFVYARFAHEINKPLLLVIHND